MLSTLAQSSSRQREILEVLLRHGWDYMRRLLNNDNAQEPELPPPAVLRNILVDLGPVYVKLGQLLSTRPELLAPEYIESLSTLQANVPPVPWQEMEALLQQELPNLMETLFDVIDPQPVAAGSIAQTHRGRLKNGREVAIKIQRPGLDRLVARDVALLKSIAELVSGTNFGKYYDAVALAEEFANALQLELDFTQEGRYCDRLRRNLSQSRWFDPTRIVIPEIEWKATTPKILVMEWLDGVPLLEAKPRDRNERQAISTLLVRVFLQQLFVDGFFHADPHPGNIFYLKDGRLALLDCGMTGTLDPRTQGLLIEIILATINLDAQRCAQLTLQLAQPVKPVNFTRLKNEYDRLLRRYYNLNLSQINFSQAFAEILQAARRNDLRWPSNMGLYSKTLANLEGVAREFNPEVNLLEEIKPLMGDLLRQQLIGSNPMQDLLSTGLELRNLSLNYPRQIDFLLEQLTTESLKLNLGVSELEGLRRSVDDSANRLSFSIVVGSLVMGAAIVFSSQQTTQMAWVSNALFWAACSIGFWLLVSIWQSGRLK
ncbi:MAG TPA: AarF/ABC1/UbiB kinase family protein [Oscillatoriales cyanobacterium M59_W2019_021]|nr:AarF/ABC1/UbiB kinase family protein [Oscillatoriales cyanobacterium M4454_W2019_049]HIK53072.1 AarF/ABC1/UbiB kinase family protein [Oscillatoriales cyanobacterium M59_W2019_021]